MTATIIDVSSAQGRIEWPVLAASGRVDGAICKATEGNGYVDPSFAANFDGARATSLLLGTYHFAHPDEMAEDAAHEADHYVATVSQHWDRSPLLFALDIEEARKIHAGAPFCAWVRAFVEQMEQRTGLLGWIYTGGPFFDEHDGAPSDADVEFFAARALWIAAYVNSVERYVALTPWRKVGHTLWQWSGDVQPNGQPGIRYPGIAQNVVDTNRFSGSIAALRALIGRPSPGAAHAKTDPAPPPPPPDSDSPTWPGTPTSKSNQRMQAVSAPIFDGPATPLRAGEAEHTPLHLREPDDQ